LDEVGRSAKSEEVDAPLGIATVSSRPTPF